MHPDEYLDLVDENDQVIGRKLRADIYAEGLRNFRVVNVLIRNSKGQLWIPRRTADKAIAPLGLDFSCGGHVISGDSYDETFGKEVSEELNIDIDAVKWRELGYIRPSDGQGRPKWFIKVYEIESDETPNYNPEDFIESYWLTPEEIMVRIESGDKVKDDIFIVIKTFYLAGNV